MERPPQALWPFRPPGIEDRDLVAPFRAELRARMDRLDCSAIAILGRVSPDRLARWYRMAR